MKSAAVIPGNHPRLIMMLTMSYKPQRGQSYNQAVQRFCNNLQRRRCCHNHRYLNRQQNPQRQQQMPYSTFNVVVSSFRKTNSGIINKSKLIVNKPIINSAAVTTARKSNGRALSSSSSSLGDKKKKTKTAQSEIIPNVALATILFGFVTSVFLYSMNSVGRGGGGGSDGTDDPLAQLKAEAQEALDHREKTGATGRMTPDEIRELESGSGGTSVADGDEAVINLEEEANSKMFHQQQQKDESGGGKKKKSWWRFGF